jgi:glutamate-1-semialdehyde 2,1-aminomutase
MTTQLTGSQAALAREVERFIARTPASRAAFERARRVMPGGNTRASVYYEPYPATVVRAAGIELTDADGNRYHDLLLNYTSMILGHANPRVVEAATHAVQSGSAVAAPVPGQIELAEELVRRIPSVEQVRFVNSGTEAGITAVRAARAFTGRDWVIKISGGYHGSAADLDAGLRDGVRPPGVPSAVATRAVPFNDPSALDAAAAQLGPELAAIILEPVLGNAGLVPPAPGYLEHVRQVADTAGAVLIFDEVITFRLSPGGYQLLAGVFPDLTCLGKIIGGGFPVGAVGGRAEIMAVFSPGSMTYVGHSGTFTGNAVTMAAGLETLRQLDGAAYARLDRLGARLVEGLQSAVEETGVPAAVLHVGSLVNLVFTDVPVTNAEAARPLDPAAAQAFHLGLMNRGIFIAPRGLFAMSTVTSEEAVDAAVSAAHEILAGL